MKKQKLLSLLLAVAMVIAMTPALFLSAAAAETPTPVNVSSVADGGKTTIDGKEYVVIRAVDTLNAALTADTAHTNNYILDADLDFTGKTFKQIVLNGIFNGNGHKMFGYNPADAGTFAAVSAESVVTVKNLTLGTADSKITIASETADSTIGVLFATSECALTVENVTVYADITAKAMKVGGFIGSVGRTLAMTGCEFNGSIDGRNDATQLLFEGGLIGVVDGATAVTLTDCVNKGSITATAAKKNSGLGGVIGYVFGTFGDITITNCANEGDLPNTVNAGVGGIIGYVTGTQNGDVAITGCINKGSITGGGRGAGIVGYYALGAASEKKTVIANCANVGEVKTISDCGGIVGGFRGKGVDLTIQTSANYGNITITHNTTTTVATGGIIGAVQTGPLTVKECLNAGAVSSEANCLHCGGILGLWFSVVDAKIANCANVGAISGRYAGGIVGSCTASVAGTELSVRYCGSFAPLTVTSTEEGEASGVVGQGGVNLQFTVNSRNNAAVSAGEKDSKSIKFVEKTMEEGLAWLTEGVSGVTFELNTEKTAIAPKLEAGAAPVPTQIKNVDPNPAVDPGPTPGDDPATGEPTPATDKPTPTTDKPTPATETPATEAPATEAPKTEKKKGCGSVIGSGALILVATLGIGVCAIRKKKAE